MTKKIKINPIIWIIFGLTILGGIGGIIYFATKKEAKSTENSQSTNQVVQNLQTQLDLVKKNLNQPQNQGKKVKLTPRLSAIESQLNKLLKEKNPVQSEVVKLEQEIKEISQELGLDKGKKDDNTPNLPPQKPDNSPNDSPNLPNQPSPDNNNPSNPGQPLPQPNPAPNPSPQNQEEEWNRKKPGLLSSARQEFISARECKTGSAIYNVKDEEWEKNWESELEKANSEAELETIEQQALKDINEIKLLSPQERLKLKDYFALNLGWEVGFRHVDGCHNVRDFTTTSGFKTVEDLNHAIKGNPNSSWERKFITFTGDFNINNKDDANKFDDWIKSDAIKKTWIVIKKNHNPKQYNTERNSFFLRKGLSDYHEFNSRKEAVDFLRKNDSYFK